MFWFVISVHSVKRKVMKRKISLSVLAVWVLLFQVIAQDTASEIDGIKMLLIDGNYQEGLEKCSRLLESNISDTTQLATVYGYAGLSCEALGDRPRAIGFYKKAVELQMPQLDVYDKLINLSKKEKNDSVYEFALLEKMKAYPEFEQEITESLAYHYVNTRQYEKLLGASDRLLEWFPGDVNFLYFKGVALENSGRADEAENLYNAVLAKDSGHVAAHMSLGMILYNKGTDIFAFRKKEYESKAKPTRTDYSIYNKGIEEGKNYYRQALPHLLNAYESGMYPGLKQVLFNTYARLEQKDKAEAYR